MNKYQPPQIKKRRQKLPIRNELYFSIWQRQNQQIDYLGVLERLINNSDPNQINSKWVEEKREEFRKSYN